MTPFTRLFINHINTVTIGSGIAVLLWLWFLLT